MTNASQTSQKSASSFGVMVDLVGSAILDGLMSKVRCRKMRGK